MATPPFSPQEFRATAEVHRELGPEYSDAVLESFFEKVDKQIQARIDAQVANALPAQRRRAPMSRDTARGLMKGVIVGGLATGIPLTIAGLLAAGNPFEGATYAVAVLVIWAVALIAALAFCVGMFARGPLDRDR